MSETKMHSEILENPRVIAQLEEANKETLISLANELKSRGVKHITFAARGTSDHASIYGQYLMTILGGKVVALAVPSALTVYGGKPQFSSDDLVIGVSQSGAAEDVLAVMEEAKAGGAVVAAITNHPDSKMAKAADWHLDCAAGEEYALAATKTFIGEIGLICLLAAYWFDNKELLESFRKLPEILEKTVKQLEESIESIAQRYIYANDGFILSRGMAYPIALEASLKIQETCFIRMKGYSVSDFYHGPFAQVDKGTAVIVYAPEGKSEKDNLAVIDRLTGMEIDPFVVTDSKEIAEKYRFSCLVPSSGNEFTSVFVMAVFAQLFAEKLCTLRNLDPDVSRNLKKVTVTK
ncbi:MAG: SIS domain-containing protein [Ruminococcaceae bacterium]|nr:SIS domain-containing protein [Oscillospiraceae bacterium]